VIDSVPLAQTAGGGVVQASGVPAHPPFEQMSPTVQAFPSSHVAPATKV
jgi:hypothetical protein